MYSYIHILHILRVKLKIQVVINVDINMWLVIMLMPDIIIMMKISRAAVSAIGIYLAAGFLCVCVMVYHSRA